MRRNGGIVPMWIPVPRYACRHPQGPVAGTTLLRAANIRTTSHRRDSSRQARPRSVPGVQPQALRDATCGSCTGTTVSTVSRRLRVAEPNGTSKFPPVWKRGVYDHHEGTRTQRPLIPMRTAGSDVHDSRLRTTT